MIIAQTDPETTLADCPIGLFLADGHLCLKTEYGNNEGRIDAYIVESGEFFWGDPPQTIASQRAQIVTPVEWLRHAGDHDSSDIGLTAAAALVERTANLSADALRLQYGEMTAQEIRTLRAVLEQQAGAILRMANIDIGDDEGDYDVG